MHTDRIDQFRRTVRVTTLAAITGLVSTATFGTCAANKSVRQKRAFNRIEQLRDIALSDEASVSNGRPKLRTKLTVFTAVRAAVVIELDVKRREVRDVLCAHIGDQVFFRSPFLSRPDHDRRSVRVIGADVNGSVTTEFLKAYPHIRLHVFDKMPDVNGSIGVGQRGGYQDSAARHIVAYLKLEWLKADG